MDNYKLINGDCIEEMEKLIDDDIKVDMVLTDPPYGTTACKWDSVIPFEEMWECLNGLTYDNTPIILFGSEPFSSNLRMSNINNFKYDWIWYKNTASGFPFAKSGQYYPIMENTEKPRSSFKRKASKSNVYGQLKNDTVYRDNGLRFPKRIISFNCLKGECNNIHRLHPTQKPVALLEYLIKTYSNEGDTVLDFTMGSGSTGVACQNLNRDFIGIELDKEYYEIAKQRIKNINKQEKLV